MGNGDFLMIIYTATQKKNGDVFILISSQEFCKGPDVPITTMHDPTRHSQCASHVPLYHPVASLHAANNHNSQLPNTNCQVQWFSQGYVPLFCKWDSRRQGVVAPTQTRVHPQASPLLVLDVDTVVGIGHSNQNKGGV